MFHKRGDREANSLPADFVPMRLLVQATGAFVELDRPDMVLGRHSEADIRLPLPDVSRRHCRFTFCSGHWIIRDLKSLNGTHLNDRLVEEARVKHGDVLRVGGFSFTIHFEPAAHLPGRDMVLPLKPILPTLPPPDSGQERWAS